MGLEGLELVMEVEDHFGITISDDESQGIVTVADLVRLIQQRVVVANLGQCLSLPCFLALRNLVRETLADKSLRLKPSTRVASLLSRQQRHQLWRRLPSILKTLPRALRRPRPLRQAVIVISLLAALGLAPIVASGFTMLGYAVLIFLLTTALLNFVTIPFRFDPPEGYETFGEITLRIVGLQAALQPTFESDEASLLKELTPLVVIALGVDADEVVMEANFVKHLGL